MSLLTCSVLETLRAVVRKAPRDVVKDFPESPYGLTNQHFDKVYAIEHPVERSLPEIFAIAASLPMRSTNSKLHAADGGNAWFMNRWGNPGKSYAGAGAAAAAKMRHATKQMLALPAPPDYYRDYTPEASNFAMPQQAPKPKPLAICDSSQVVWPAVPAEAAHTRPIPKPPPPPPMPAADAAGAEGAAAPDTSPTGIASMLSKIAKGAHAKAASADDASAKKRPAAAGQPVGKAKAPASKAGGAAGGKGLLLGCGKCRGSPSGCLICKKPTFKGKRWQREKNTGKKT